MTYDMSARDDLRRVAWMGNKRAVVSNVFVPKDGDAKPAARAGRRGRGEKLKKWAQQIEREKKTCTKLVVESRQLSESREFARIAHTTCEEMWAATALPFNALGFILETGLAMEHDRYTDTLTTLEGVMRCAHEETLLV